MSNPPSAPAPLPGTASILPTNRACNGCSTAKVACAKSTGPDARCTRCEEKDVDCAYRPRKRPDLHATIDRLTAEKAELIARHVQEIAEKDDLIARLRAEVAQSQSTSRRPWTTVEVCRLPASLRLTWNTESRTLDRRGTRLWRLYRAAGSLPVRRSPSDNFIVFRRPLPSRRHSSQAVTVPREMLQWAQDTGAAVISSTTVLLR
ncbi:hypothetical protein EXIGLDRAFT_41555 [Exidia glandulosa HHB12029]|uniref:Zn(2)-C6 fungal-type domain-containing protein n=1 Tax=Exidia glandulosa HHB12029 TaxID=1314781 RepID=A0A165IK89_EXIGL|nr:hypothetical protein EXIGLDRAFT_41555 [Exidia glandulosa HHB12029]